MNRPASRANWGHGRMRSMESIANFSAVFCKLNGISLPDLAKFLKNYLQLPEWPPTSLDAIGLQRLSTLLDEPEDVVASVMPPLVWQSAHPILKGGLQAAMRDDDIHFCRECLALGYHSSLHEVPWLNSCPILNRHDHCRHS